VFRIPKPGAAFYQAQASPEVRTVIQPALYWDFGPHTPRGPGKHAAIFSNCDRLELLVDGRPYTSPTPGRENFPHAQHPPFFVDLDLECA
jgi:beta-galactosidase